MSVDSTENDYQTLGDLLQQQRLSRGLSLDAIAEETKISLHMLEAMESNAYNKLPAEAFSRGFYTLYAKSLQLDPQDILDRYQQEAVVKPKGHRRLPPTRRAKDVSNMAARPTSTSFFYLGLILFSILLVGGLLCWYFSWNPATFLSEKLRSLQLPALEEQTSQMQGSNSTPDAPPAAKDTGEITAAAAAKGNNSENNLIIVKSVPDASPPPPVPAPTISPHYFINATFSQPVQVTVTIDGGQTITQKYGAGETADWQAGKQIILTFPSNSGIALTINDLPFTVPAGTEPFTTLSIPEDLLQ